MLTLPLHETNLNYICWREESFTKLVNISPLYAQVFSVLLLVHPLAIPTNDFVIFNLNHRNNDATVILKSCNAA